MLVDQPVDDLRAYTPERSDPADFDQFWSSTLDEARSLAWPAKVEPHEAGLRTVDVFDVTFSGFGGHPVRAWLLLPRHVPGELPCVVEYLGYGAGRGLPHEWLTWSAAGYAHLVMDTRGQGSNGGHAGVTPDPDPIGSPQAPGVMTRGVVDRSQYYYRRLFTDAVLAVDVVREHPRVSADRVAVTGISQGGGIALAVAGLVPNLAAVLADVPFLCHFRHAVDITNSGPYHELVQYCRVHRDRTGEVFATLDYFDAVNFGARADTPALFSVGLMDAICPPSTVFAAYNHYAGPKDITVWPFNGHEGGAAFQRAEQFRFVATAVSGA